MLTLTAVIQIEPSQIEDFTIDEVVEGVHARLYPVVSCHPDEFLASDVRVLVTHGGADPLDANLVRAARDLRTEDDSNPEYDRALVELVYDLTGMSREEAQQAILGDRDS